MAAATFGSFLGSLKPLALGKSPDKKTDDASTAEPLATRAISWHNHVEDVENDEAYHSKPTLAENDPFPSQDDGMAISLHGDDQAEQVADEEDRPVESSTVKPPLPEASTVQLDKEVDDTVASDDEEIHLSSARRARYTAPQMQKMRGSPLVGEPEPDPKEVIQDWIKYVHARSCFLIDLRMLH